MRTYTIRLCGNSRLRVSNIAPSLVYTRVSCHEGPSHGCSPASSGEPLRFTIKRGQTLSHSLTPTASISLLVNRVCHLSYHTTCHSPSCRYRRTNTSCPKPAVKTSPTRLPQRSNPTRKVRRVPPFHFHLPQLQPASFPLPPRSPTDVDSSNEQRRRASPSRTPSKAKSMVR